MVINGVERSGTKRRRAKRQKPRSGMASVIALSGKTITIGEIEYAYKDFSEDGVNKYQFVKI